MYNVDIPATIHQIIAVFFQLRMWSKDDESSFYERGRKLFYYLYLVSFIVSIAVGAHLTDDRDERIFLTVTSITYVVLLNKLWFILWKQNVIFLLVDEIGKLSTDDREEFVQVNNKLKMLMRFVQFFLLMILSAYIFTTILFPLASDKRLFFNIAFPLSRSNSEIATWMAFAFTAGGMFGTEVSCLLTAILWYLLYGFALKYELLGKQFRKMGMIRTHEADGSEPRPIMSLFAKDLIVAIRPYDEINGKLEKFESTFSNLFFLQISTGSLCICGSVYCLAFNSHKDLIQDGMYCILLAYCFFDIFMVVYLANEIKLLSGRLLYCLFESNWMEQTQPCKNCVIILGERLKKPQEMIVGKIYPLNLQTFNSRGAYSMFNVLQTFRK